MKDYRERTKKQYPLPSSVQELLPIVKIARDGVFQLEDGREEDEKQYDKAYLFDDTNFATMDDLQKADFLKLYVSILNSMNVSFKIILMNSSRNMAKIRRHLFLHTQRILNAHPLNIREVRQNLQALFEIFTIGRVGDFVHYFCSVPST